MPYTRFIKPLDPANLTVQRCQDASARRLGKTPRQDASARRLGKTPRQDASARRLGKTPRQDASPRILIVKFGALGDILMATPLLTALRQAYPQAHLTWVVEQSNRQAIDANPFIDEIVLWDSLYLRSLLSTRPRNWIKNWFGLRWLCERVRLKYRLHRRFTTLISFHPEQDLPFLRDAAPPISIGVFQSPRQTAKDYTACYTHAYTSRHTENLTALDFPAHQTDTYLLPLDALHLPAVADKRMVMGYTAEDADLVDRLLQSRGIGPGFVVMAPKTTWETKCWPEERWAALGDALAAEQCQIVLMGSAAEGEVLERVAAQMQNAPRLLVKSLSFRQAAALIDRAALCVSSDSGPMHVAAAVGTPFVSLFGPTPVSRYAPLEGRGRVLLHPVPCGPCMEQVCPNPPDTQNQCLRLLSVAEVRDAALLVLNETHSC